MTPLPLRCRSLVGLPAPTRHTAGVASGERRREFSWATGGKDFCYLGDDSGHLSTTTMIRLEADGGLRRVAVPDAEGGASEGTGAGITRHWRGRRTGRLKKEKAYLRAASCSAC